jgi:hydroxymethylpyrimidine/phosphomethylpyrimidine kinase
VESVVYTKKRHFLPDSDDVLEMTTHSPASSSSVRKAFSASPPQVLSIAGSDPSGGAGIQADLKTFSSLGCYGMSVLTALTAQNTQGVSQIHLPPVGFFVSQLQALWNDVEIDAIKIGMLGSSEVIMALSKELQQNANNGEYM